MNWADIQGQERAVRLLRSALASGQVHHAYLLAGPQGTGRERLARVFAQAANCEAEPEQRPCGRCDNCKLIERGNFPDVSWHMPQSERIARGQLQKADLEGSPSKEIRVDEIRELSKRLSLAAVRGRRKVAILAPADAMNERAQNTLLKTLEEPPPGTTFLLVSANPDALLPTIRSRCARVQFVPVARPPPLERELVESGERALAAPDERDALEVAEAYGDRDAALGAARAVQAWTRELLVGPEFREQRELEDLAAGVKASPRALLEQASLCADVIEALEQNGNGRLQIERLLIGARELRRG